VESLNHGKNIIKTKLIYAFPSMKLLNPHAHIDGIPNYIIIMTLSNFEKSGKPYMLAMYSAKSLKHNDTAT
jgi:hypothetical protein